MVIRHEGSDFVGFSSLSCVASETRVGRQKMSNRGRAYDGGQDN